MVPAVHEICHIDSQDFVGPICHPPVGPSGITGDIRATSCTDCLWQSSPIHTLQQIYPSLLLSNFVCIEGIHLVPPMLHESDLAMS
jgi:hypothetical protein